MIKSKNQEHSIKNIFVDNFTNGGWGLLSEYYMINQGYGNKDNNIYRLFHFKNVLNAIVKNMIFSNYYIHQKSKDEIVQEIHNLTFYNQNEIWEMLYEVLRHPVESNFEIIGYLKLKAIYDELIKDDFYKSVQFYDVLIESAYLNSDLIKQFKLNTYE